MHLFFPVVIDFRIDSVDFNFGGAEGVVKIVVNELEVEVLAVRIILNIKFEITLDVYQGFAHLDFFRDYRFCLLYIESACVTREDELGVQWDEVFIRLAIVYRVERDVYHFYVIIELNSSRKISFKAYV